MDRNQAITAITQRQYRVAEYLFGRPTGRTFDVPDGEDPERHRVAADFIPKSAGWRIEFREVGPWTLDDGSYE